MINHAFRKWETNYETFSTKMGNFHGLIQVSYEYCAKTTEISINLAGKTIIAINEYFSCLARFSSYYISTFSVLH